MDVNAIRKAAVIAFCVITALGNVKTYIDGTARNELAIIQNADSYYLDNSDKSVSSTIPEPEIQNTMPAEPEQSDNRININTASEEQLTTLKGIGPTKAKAIIDYRDSYGGFVALEEIMEVKGIGEGTYNKIKNFISLD